MENICTDVSDGREHPYTSAFGWAWIGTGVEGSDYSRRRFQNTSPCLPRQLPRLVDLLDPTSSGKAACILKLSQFGDPGYFTFGSSCPASFRFLCFPEEGSH